MIISAANQITYDGLLNQTLGNVRARILNSSVSLKGPNPKGSDFDGSGVMLCVSPSDGSTILVTAKHNLEVYWDEGNRPPLTDIEASFRQKVKIYYKDGIQFNDEPDQMAAIDEVIPVTTVGAGEWDYDVVILKSHDEGLSQVCNANQIYPASNVKQKTAYDSVMRDVRLYLSKTQAKGITSYFIQTGFGRVRDTSGSTTLPTQTPGPNRHGGLQYRATNPMARETVTVYNQVGQTGKYDRFDEAVQLEADANSSTAQGDSGGPLYLTYYDKNAGGWQLFVIGVTTGGDMSTAKEQCPPQNVLVANNISTSLAECYTQGLFL